jgi:hypothetical protein
LCSDDGFSALWSEIDAVIAGRRRGVQESLREHSVRLHSAVWSSSTTITTTTTTTNAMTVHEATARIDEADAILRREIGAVEAETAALVRRLNRLADAIDAAAPAVAMVAERSAPASIVVRVHVCRCT